MIGYEFEAELSDDDKNRVIFAFYGPRERLRIADAANAPASIASLATKGSDLVVEKVYVTKDRHIEYSFRGHDGRFGGGHFLDARDCRHCFGAMIRHDDKTVVVALNGDFDNPVGSDIFEVSGNPEKYVAYNQGFDSESALIDYLTTEGALIGEFNVAGREDGSWSLVSIPWSANASDRDIEAARDAVERRVLSPAI
jgi:hypothetical protein